MGFLDRLPAVPVPLRRGRRSSDPVGHATSCAAPAVQLRFDPNGLVTSCCRTLQPLGHVGNDSLLSLWEGELRRRAVDALARNDWSAGCQRCGAEVAQEGRAVAYASSYDQWMLTLATEGLPGWPWRMEFNLSNTCNLQCIQCDGESSSMIRLHREQRPPLPAVYGDRFFGELRQFLPHLREAVFAGGEPFLSVETHRVWDMIVEDAPHVRCSVVTNATQWSDRIAAWFDRLRFDVVFSIDGITRPTYESIRVGASFSQVMRNVDRMLELVRGAGSTASVNHCLMPQNVHEFDELLRWAESRELPVNVCVVRAPAACSIARLPIEQIREIDRFLAERHAGVTADLRLNRAAWSAERDRIASWAAADDEAASHTVLFFRCQGEGPYDDRDAVEELTRWVGDGDLIRVSLDEDDLIRWCDAPALHDPTSLVGRSYQDLNKAVSARFGQLDRYEVSSTGDDRVDARARFGRHEARITFVAHRNARGWADSATILVAVAPVGAV